ncbi:MAG TPA: AI-2E family transporter [Nitrospiria bacterium]|jgi:predicted PurR-regulated permease PerM
MKSNETSPIIWILISVASLVIIIAGLRAAQSIVVPFLLAGFIALIFAPSLFWLQRKRIPILGALLIIFVVIFLAGIGAAAIIGMSLDDFSKALPEYQERLTEGKNEVLQGLAKTGFNITEKGLLKSINPGSAMDLIGGLLSGLGGMLSNSVLILLTVIFILLEAAGFPTKLRSALGPKATFVHFDKFSQKIQSYLVIKTIISLITGLVIAGWLAVLGVNFPLLWGFLAFVLNFIPNIGSIIAAVPAVVLALIDLGIVPSFLVISGYVAVNVVMGNVVEPRFLGRSLGLSPLVVFLSLVFWGWVLGPVGMVLSVPLTMMVKIALDSREDTQWMAMLLGSGPPAGKS